MGNTPRQCFDCGNDVYFSRLVKRKDGSDRPAPLDTPYEEGDQFPVYHECKGRPKPKNNYEKDSQTGNQWPDKANNNNGSPPTTNPPSTGGKANLAITTREDIQFIKDKLLKIEELVEAAMKGNLFQSASQIPQGTSSNKPSNETVVNTTSNMTKEEVVGDEEEVIKKDEEEVV